MLYKLQFNEIFLVQLYNYSYVVFTFLFLFIFSETIPLFFKTFPKESTMM